MTHGGDVEMSAQEKKEENERERREQEEEADELQETTWFQVFMTFVWIGAASVMIWYLTQIVDQYKSAKANPSSTILVLEKARLPFPQIVICNWNCDGTITDPTPTGDCDICALTLSSCWYNLTTDCSERWQYRQIQTKGGLFTCYQYNADPKELQFSDTTGYSGSMATVWVVPAVNRSDPPPDARMGVQVTFKPSGTVTEDDIYNEVNFAAMGFDTFFSLTYVNTIHNELDSSDPNYNTSNYQAAASTVNLMQVNDPDWNNDLNTVQSFIGVSFSYQTLSLQQVNFDIAYNLNNLFGDFAGMIGTLMGLDVIKLAAGLPMGYLAWKSRSWRPLQEAFNG